MSPSNSSPELIELKSFKIMPHMLATSSINHNGIASGTGVGVAWDAALELAMEASISEDDLENEEVHQAFRRIKNFFACPEPRLIIESRTGTIMKGIVVGILAKWREDGDNEDDEEVIMRMRDVEKLFVYPRLLNTFVLPY